jgi:hypothetical protein
MINIHISPFFPDENFGGDYKNSLVYRLFEKDDEEAFTAEIKSVQIEIFDPNTKTYSVIKVVNKPSEIWKLAWYVFDYIASDVDLKLKGQCNHTFVFYLYTGKYAHVCFSTDDILTEKEFSLFD